MTGRMPVPHQTITAETAVPDRAMIGKMPVPHQTPHRIISGETSAVYVPSGSAMMPGMADSTQPQYMLERSFEEALRDETRGLPVAVDAGHIERMAKHFELVVEANRRFNLTRITDPEAAAVKHYADSLSLLRMPEVDPAAPLTVLDVGTGAGFPAVPLAIVCPAWRITAIDGTGKKARFVAEAASALGLDNLKAVHARSEDFARRRHRPFDLVLLRAVAKMGEGLHAVRSLIASGGYAVFYKTAHISDEELEDSGPAANACGLEAVSPTEVMLLGPEGNIHHTLFPFRKLAKAEQLKGP